MRGRVCVGECVCACVEVRVGVCVRVISVACAYLWERAVKCLRESWEAENVCVRAWMRVWMRVDACVDACVRTCVRVCVCVGGCV